MRNGEALFGNSSSKFGTAERIVRDHGYKEATPRNLPVVGTDVACLKMAGAKARVNPPRTT
jgi:hypothetical protein